jgi:hypothetical protein
MATDDLRRVGRVQENEPADDCVEGSVQLDGEDVTLDE